jgi:RimJ/RimL family protein N-acetyltransferase
MGEEVTLRPPGEDDLPVLLQVTQDPETTGQFGWFGWTDPRRWQRGWDENALIGPDGGVLMVVRGQERLGMVSWRRRPATPASYFWEIGIALLPEARGHGSGTQAQRLLTRYLFAHTPVHRIQAATEDGNIAEMRALEKAGFSREGVMRGTGWRDGAWRDGVLYSILRTDPPS